MAASQIAAFEYLLRWRDSGGSGKPEFINLVAELDVIDLIDLHKEIDTLIKRAKAAKKTAGKSKGEHNARQGARHPTRRRWPRATLRPENSKRAWPFGAGGFFVTDIPAVIPRSKRCAGVRWKPRYRGCVEGESTR